MRHKALSRKPVQDNMTHIKLREKRLRYDVKAKLLPPPFAIQFPELCIAPHRLETRCIFYTILSSERRGKRAVIFRTSGTEARLGGDKTAKLPQSTQNAKMAR